MAIEVAATTKAISDAFKSFFEWMIQKKKHANVDKLKIAVDAAEDYIHINEKFGKYKNVSTKKRIKLMHIARKKFFDYNQG